MKLKNLFLACLIAVGTMGLSSCDSGTTSTENDMEDTTSTMDGSDMGGSDMSTDTTTMPSDTATMDTTAN